MPDSLQDLPETPAGWAQRWTTELSAAKKKLKEWHEQGDKIIDRYIDDRPPGAESTRLNLFTANTQTMEALLFGKTPKVDVERRFADSADDVARVAAEMLERLLNTDIERDSDTQEEAFRNALADRLRPGLGNVRLRYEVETEQTKEIPAIRHEETGEELAPAVPPREAKKEDSETVEVDYLYWKDQLWSPARTFNEVRWWAFANDMSEDDFVERFGEEKKDSFKPSTESNGNKSEKYKDPLARCRVWEIWSKERETVDWYVEGQDETLDHKDDPLELEGFWPFPRPMFANLTTTDLIPTPDFALAQDLYDGIDTLEDRISLLEDAVRVAGLYDKGNEGVQRLLSEKGRNALYPVDAWAVFAEKGGIRGAIDWFPLEVIVGALDKLRECRTEKIGLLFQVTGMSDIMRGQATTQTTATEQAIKARFASVRVQSLQDEFARFCSDVQKIKAEIISKHFDAATILSRSNSQYMPEVDQQYAQQAAEMILSGECDYRISVNPDSVSLTDFAALKQERFEFANTIATYFQGMMPLIQIAAQARATQPTMKFVIGLAQSMVAGLKGSSEMEGIFDEFVAEMKQMAQQAAMTPPQPPPPDPKVVAAQVKGQAEQFKAKADIVKTGMDMQHAQTKHQMDMTKLAAEAQVAQQDHIMGIQSAEAKARADAVGAVNKVTQPGPG